MGELEIFCCLHGDQGCVSQFSLTGEVAGVQLQVGSHRMYCF
jgi:hypothetical protein